MIDLEAIKDRLAAATPGPWVVRFEPDADGCDDYWRIEMPTENGGHRTQMANPRHEEWTPERREDWVLIANAPADLAALIAEVEELRAELELKSAAIGGMLTRTTEK